MAHPAAGKKIPDDEHKPNAVVGWSFWVGKDGKRSRSEIVAYVPEDETRVNKLAVRMLARLLLEVIDRELEQAIAEHFDAELKAKKIGNNEYWCGTVDGRSVTFGNLKSISKEEALKAYAEAKARAVANLPRKRFRKSKVDKATLDNLPFEISTATFARLAGCSRTTVLQFIRQNVIPARVLNEASKRPTYRIQSWVLGQMLGLAEPEPKYVSKLLPGRL